MKAVGNLTEGTGEPVRSDLWPLTKGVLQAAACLIIAAVFAYSGNLIDNAEPNGAGSGPHHQWTRLLLLLTSILIAAAFIIAARSLIPALRRNQRQAPRAD